MTKTGMFLCLIFCAMLFPAEARSGSIEERVKYLEAENAQLKGLLIRLQERLDAIEKTRPIGKSDEKPAQTEKTREKR